MTTTPIRRNQRTVGSFPMRGFLEEDFGDRAGDKTTDFLGGISSQLNRQREEENRARLDGTDPAATRESIERFAGDAFKDAANNQQTRSTATTGTGANLVDATTTTGEVAAPEGTETRLGLETVDNPDRFVSGRTGQAVTSTGTDEYYSNLYPRYVREDTVKGYGANFPGAQVGGSNPYKETTYEYLGTPLPPMDGGGNGGGGGGGTNPEEPERPEEEFLDRTLRSFIGSQAGEANTIGARGIGEYMGYYGDNFTGNDEILAKAREEGLKFGPNAALTLGINTDAASAQGGDYTEGAIGLSAVNRLRDRGLSDTAIKQFAQEQGLKYGPEALKSLGADASYAYQPPAPSAPPSMPGVSSAGQAISQAYQPAQYQGSGAIGASGIERLAAARGITFQQAAQQAQSTGLKLGAAAQARL